MVNKNKITIILEDDEIETFNNIINFALDLDVKEHCMFDDERKLANKLDRITENIF